MRYANGIITVTEYVPGYMAMESMTVEYNIQNKTYRVDYNQWKPIEEGSYKEKKMNKLVEQLKAEGKL